MIGSADQRRANVYGQLASLLTAGIPIAEALARMVERGGLAERMLRPVAQGVAEGLELGPSFERAPVSRVESALVAAGAHAGRLPECFEQLAGWFEERARTRREVAAALAYPLFVLHLAVLLPALPALVASGGGAFLRAVLVPFGVAYGVVAALLLLRRALLRARPELWASIVVAVPGVGGVVRRGSTAAGLRALAALYGSGVPIISALDVAAAASGPLQAGALRRAARRLADGEEAARALSDELRPLSRAAADLAATGLRTGELDKLLVKAAEQLEAEARLGRAALIKVLSVGALLIAGAVVALKVIGFYSAMFSKVGGL